jgi:hypothetical protein
MASIFCICYVVYILTFNGIMSLLWHSILRQSLLRHSILRQSLHRHLLLRQSLLRLLILRQWPIVFAILVLLAIQMQYGIAHLTWKGHGFYPGVRSFFRMQRYCFKAFQRGPTKYFLQKKILFHVDLIKMLSLISLFLRFPSYFPSKFRIAQLERTIKMQEKYLDKRTTKIQH